MAETEGERGNMWRKIPLPVAGAMALAVAIVGVAGAAMAPIPPPTALTVDVDGQVAPVKLPKHRLAPVTLSIQGRISNFDEANPPSLEEVKFTLDKNLVLDGEGLAACGIGQLRDLDTEAARRVCGDSIVGTGSAHVGLLSSGRLLVVPSQLTLFNGGVVDGSARLLIHGYIPAPRSMPLVVNVKIGKARNGGHGQDAVARFPSGIGSMLDFRLKIGRRFPYKSEKRSYLMARCPEAGRLRADVTRLTFSEGPAGSSDTSSSLKGSVSAPCEPQS